MSGKVGIGLVCSFLGLGLLACVADRAEGTASSDVTAAKPALVISQIYASGGTTDDGYDGDFVEIFNRGASAASMKDLDLAYIPESGDVASRFVVSMFLPDADLAPGAHYLVKLTVPGTKGKALTPFDQRSPQVSAEDDFPAALRSSGYLVLIGHSLAQSCVIDSEASACDAIDLVGIGRATRKEGSPIAAIPSGQAMSRKWAGCRDTNDNASDFEPSDPHPRSTASLPLPCGNILLATDDAGNADAASDAGEPASVDGDSVDASTPASDAGARPTSTRAPATGTDEHAGQAGAISTADTPAATVAAPKKDTAAPTSAASTCAMGNGPARTSLLGGVGVGLALAAVVRRRRFAR